MKKNKMMRFASVLLVAVLLSTCAISGTFAKYTSTASGTATAKVAKWDVKVGEVSLNATTKDFTFNLFETIVDTYDAGAQSRDDANKTVEDGHIAPGTKGTYTITLTNASEVNVEYTATITPPAEFAGVITFNISPANGSLADTQDIVVTWEWPYDGDDSKDLALGVSGLENYEIKVSITVTQVD
jgi:hypothetical protein